MENDFLKVIETRRSCRKYKPEQITDEELKAVLEAGTYAPTSRGMQSPYIVAVQKKEVLARLAKMNAEIMPDSDRSRWVSAQPGFRTRQNDDCRWRTDPGVSGGGLLDLQKYPEHRSGFHFQSVRSRI